MEKAPTLFKQYKPMLKYLEKESGLKFKLVYSSSYKEMIENFKNGKIDVIELGPLPFVKLNMQYKHSKPFVTFLSKDGKDSYNCLLVTTDKDKNTLKDLNSKTKIKLTRKLSTCGYLMSEKMLNKEGLSLENFDYEYIGTHTDVILKVILSYNTVGGVKSSVFENYKHIGNVKAIATSDDIPGFAFVANTKTLSKENIQKMTNALTKLHPLENEKDFEITHKWSKNTMYGCIPTKKDAYKNIQKALEEIVIP
jgi:phosphonate transport system substrate-binding protein